MTTFEESQLPFVEGQPDIQQELEESEFHISEKLQLLAIKVQKQLPLSPQML